jgi:hypothetical protein
MILYSSDYPQSFFDDLIAKARVEQISDFGDAELERVFGLCATRTACINGLGRLLLMD